MSFTFPTVGFYWSGSRILVFIHSVLIARSIIDRALLFRVSLNEDGCVKQEVSPWQWQRAHGSGMPIFYSMLSLLDLFTVSSNFLVYFGWQMLGIVNYESRRFTPDTQSAVS